MIDRLPPHDVDCEQCVLGSVLLSPIDCLPECQQIITVPEFFYDLRNRTIWDVVCQMPADKINVISVRSKLNDAGMLDKIGGDFYLNGCIDKVPSIANLPAWIEIVASKYILRRTIQVCTSIIADAYEGKEASLILPAAEAAILAINPVKTKPSDIKTLVREAINKLEQKFNAPNSMMGLTTGLADLDKQTDGLHEGELIVLAGFPSTGKTALAANIAVTNALAGVPVAFFSAEMRPVQITIRAICSTSRVNYHRMKDVDLAKLPAAQKQLANSPLHIESAHGFSIAQVQAMGRRLKQKHGIKLAVVDYIQLLQGTGDNREQVVSSISKKLKAMALELNIPVIGLSQLNDDGKLRESRALGQDADSIWMLENDGEHQPAIQPIKLTIQKCRDGETGKVPLTFLKEYTLFQNSAKIQSEDVPNDEY
jgi:replicative DNA helicase